MLPDSVDGALMAVLKTNGAGVLAWVDQSGGGGSSQNLFETIAVAGQTNVVADSTTDTLTFVAGSNMTITTDTATDTITFASSGGGGGGGTPGGANTQVQFNDSSTFGGDAGLVYNKTSDTLTGVNIAATTITDRTSGHRREGSERLSMFRSIQDISPCLPRATKFSKPLAESFRTEGEVNPTSSNPIDRA